MKSVKNKLYGDGVWLVLRDSMTDQVVEILRLLSKGQTMVSFHIALRLKNEISKK